MNSTNNLKIWRLDSPRNINEAYLYYKYIVRKSEADFLSDFKYFQKPISRDQWLDDELGKSRKEEEEYHVSDHLDEINGRLAQFEQRMSEQEERKRREEDRMMMIKK